MYIPSCHVMSSVAMLSCHNRRHKQCADLYGKYERYPLVVRDHLPLFECVLRHRFVPRQVVSVFDPAVAGHKLNLSLREMNRSPARDRLAHVLQQNEIKACHSATSADIMRS